MESDHKTYGAVILGLLVSVLSLYLLLKTRFGVTDSYDAIYWPIGVLTVIAAALFYAVDFTKYAGRNSWITSAFFLSEEDDARPLSSTPWIPIGVAVGLGLLVFFMVSSSGFSFYSVPNAVGSSLSYTPAELAQATPANYFLTAVIPGFFEEFLGFALIGSLSLVLTAVTALIMGNAAILESLLVRWFWIVSLCAAEAYAFMYAHAQFVGDGATSLWAFFFEFSVQMLNQLGGVFVSWIPHALHNAAVIATKTLSIAPLGAFL